MTLKEAEQRRAVFLNKARMLHEQGFTVGQINDELDDQYDLVYDTSYNTKAGDLGKVRKRLIHWIENTCCGQVNKPHAIRRR